MSVVAVGAISAGGSIASGIFGSRAARKAAKRAARKARKLEGQVG